MSYHVNMSSSLSDILGKRQYSEPPEIQIIKQFVVSAFGHSPQVKMTEHSIIITLPSAALAGALRPRLHELQELMRTKKRLSIRIGTG